MKLSNKNVWHLQNCGHVVQTVIPTASRSVSGYQSDQWRSQRSQQCVAVQQPGWASGDWRLCQTWQIEGCLHPHWGLAEVPLVALQSMGPQLNCVHAGNKEGDL